MNLRNNKAFTLVELLIVIGLLGAIALIVLSAINPIEQSNRARDTKFKSDSSQLISAIERYFTQRAEFPWQTNTPATYTSADTAFPFTSATSLDIGICGTSAAACSTDGLLIVNDELKTEFRNRDFIKGNPSAVDKKINVGKATGSSSSIYACFVPLSKSMRQKSCTDGKVYTLSGSTRSAVSCTAASTWVVTPAGSEWVVCLPE